MTTELPSFSHIDTTIAQAPAGEVPAPRFSDDTDVYLGQPCSGACGYFVTRSQAELMEARERGHMLVRKHVALGLCGPCYHSHNRHGTLGKFPSIQHDRETLVAAFVAARREDSKISQQKVADSIGVGRSALVMALRAACRDGDRRLYRDESHRIHVKKD